MVNECICKVIVEKAYNFFVLSVLFVVKKNKLVIMEIDN